MKNKKLNKDLFTPVKKIIKENEKFIITAHETPDGDALGSEAALSHVLKSMGKEVRIFNADPMSNKFDFLTEGCDFEVLEEEEQLPRDLEEYVCMILDTNDTDNIGQVKDMVLSRVRKYFIIDHHENEYPIMEGNLISAEASSSCELIYKLCIELGVEINFLSAQALFTGIVYDTGSFVYPKTSADTFYIAYKLVSLGVDPTFVFSKIYESNSVSALQLQSKVLSSLELFFENQVAIQYMSKTTILECNAKYEESDTIINVPLRSERIRVSVFFKENLEGQQRCSLRSKGEINVAKIAQTFGGGGHKTAAGFKCDDSISATKTAIIEMLQPFFKSSHTKHA